MDLLTTRNIPRLGMLAYVRNRRGIIDDIQEYDKGNAGAIRLVNIQYLDQRQPRSERLLWEKEFGARVLEPNAMPDIANQPPMEQKTYHALRHYAAWNALSPIKDIYSGRVSAAAPFFGAIQVEDFQLEPLVKTLRMPRISMLIADDVGLGKTIEAGLILTELIIKRRIRKIMILTPAALKDQWQEEMYDKFALNFDAVDRDHTIKLKREYGLNVNAWGFHSKIITSYHYLKQEDVKQSFLAYSRKALENRQAMLPWDLLIVDEAHNLMPRSAGEESDLTKMLREIAPFFEHRIFLTATPHNGYTRSFTGLMQILNPTMFTQDSKMTPEMKKRLPKAFIRRLKKDINAADVMRGRNARFASRELKQVVLNLSPEEMYLSEALANLKSRVMAGLGDKKDKFIAQFAFEVLNKRLLSCPFTFGESWLRFKQGYEGGESIDASDVKAAQRALGDECTDDREYEKQSALANELTGSWLRPFVGKYPDEIKAIENGLKKLKITGDEGVLPSADTRVEALLQLIKTNILKKDDERLIVFTEYKVTQNYLVRRLREILPKDGQIAELYGGMDADDRKKVKTAFNDGKSAVKVLVATDAAAEGLNLQESARMLLHFDVPWNPARLEQRNGRVDRHGQARDVMIYHFVSENDADLRFLGRIVEKAEQMREDLGAIGELFDKAMQERFNGNFSADAVFDKLDTAATKRQKKIHEDLNLAAEEESLVDELRDRLEITPATLAQTFETGLQIELNSNNAIIKPKVDEPGLFVLQNTVRLGKIKELSTHLCGERNAWLYVAFDPAAFVHKAGGRDVFKPRADTRLLHLAHPGFRRALAELNQYRYPAVGDRKFEGRWYLSEGPIENAQAEVFLTLEELAINELGEIAHQWVHTVKFPIARRALRKVDEATVVELNAGQPCNGAAKISAAREIWDVVHDSMRSTVAEYRDKLHAELTTLVSRLQEKTLKEESQKYTDRLSELDKLIAKADLEEIKQEITEDIEMELFEERREELKAQLRDLEQEQRLRNQNLYDIRDKLNHEKVRVLEQLIPRRFTLRGEVQVFPVCVEIRLAV